MTDYIIITCISSNILYPIYQLIYVFLLVTHHSIVVLFIIFHIWDTNYLILCTLSNTTMLALKTSAADQDCIILIYIINMFYVQDLGGSIICIVL